MATRTLAWLVECLQVPSCLLGDLGIFGAGRTLEGISCGRDVATVGQQPPEPSEAAAASSGFPESIAHWKAVRAVSASPWRASRFPRPREATATTGGV